MVRVLLDPAYFNLARIYRGTAIEEGRASSSSVIRFPNFRLVTGAYCSYQFVDNRPWQYLLEDRLSLFSPCYFYSKLTTRPLVNTERAGLVRLRMWASCWVRLLRGQVGVFWTLLFSMS